MRSIFIGIASFALTILAILGQQAAAAGQVIG
jgi:hypothetical protein